MIYRWEHHKDRLGPFWSVTGDVVGHEIPALVDMTGARSEIRNYVDHEDWRCGLTHEQFQRVNNGMDRSDKRLLYSEGYDLVVYRVKPSVILMGKQQVTFDSTQIYGRRVIRKGAR